MNNLAQENKYKKIITALSIIIPIAVAALFGVNLRSLGFDVAPLKMLPPIYAFTNGVTAVLLVGAVIAIKKGNKKLAKVGAFSTTKNYEKYLNELLDYQASESPANHIKRHEIIKGDASKTIKKYLKSNQQTLISLAYFDMDIYKPTKDCLKSIKPYLTKGSIIGFDEPNSKDFPGETIAIKEVFGNLNFKLYQSKFSAGSCYMIIK